MGGSEEAQGGEPADFVLIPALSITTDVTLSQSLSLSGPQFLKCNKE